MGYLIIRFRIRMPEIRIDRIISRLIIIPMMLTEEMIAFITLIVTSTESVEIRINRLLNTDIRLDASSGRRAAKAVCVSVGFKQLVD